MALRVENPELRAGAAPTLALPPGRGRGNGGWKAGGGVRGPRTVQRQRQILRGGHRGQRLNFIPTNHSWAEAWARAQAQVRTAEAEYRSWRGEPFPSDDEDGDVDAEC